MYQRTIIIGHLGRDPELRYTQTGQAVTNFSVATNRKWKGNNGVPREETTWFQVSAWGNLAEICNQYLSKGRQVLVEGRLNSEKGEPRVWQDRSGDYRASYDLVADTVRFLGGGREEEAEVGPAFTGDSSRPVHPEDSIPF